MKNENAFNAWLSKEIRCIHTKGYHHVKISDKFTAGVSDFLLWGHGKHSVLEVKYVSQFPKEGCKLLKHPFEGAQITFMESIGLTGNRAHGLIAAGDKKDGLLYLMDWKDIPPSGNWEIVDFSSHQKKLRYTWDNWRSMIDYCLTGGHEYRGF